MRSLLALFAMSLSVISALPLEMVPKELELEKCDPAPCPAVNSDSPPLPDSKDVLVLTAEQMLEAKQISVLEANQTEATTGWSGYLNNYKANFSYAGTTTSAIRGFYTYFSRTLYDRRFQVYSATYPSGMLLAGSSNEYWVRVNTYGQSSPTIYRKDAVVVGVVSYYSATYKDRMFYLKFRKINTALYRLKHWTWTAYSKFGKDVSYFNGYCASRWMMGFITPFGKQYSDRLFRVLCGELVKKTVTTKAPTRSPTPAKTPAPTKTTVPAWVTQTHAVAKSTTVTNSVSVTRKK